MKKKHPENKWERKQIANKKHHKKKTPWVGEELYEEFDNLNLQDHMDNYNENEAY